MRKHEAVSYLSRISQSEMRSQKLQMSCFIPKKLFNYESLCFIVFLAQHIKEQKSHIFEDEVARVKSIKSPFCQF